MPSGTVTVSGYYGCGNAGDEAVLAGMREAFGQLAGGGVRLVPLSENPDQTRALHGLDARQRMSMRSVRSALSESQLLISGGGSLLQDTTSLRSLIYYLWIARMGLQAKVPVMFYAQGIGPLRRPAARWLVRMTANRVSYITVRDEASEHLLKSIGVNRPPIEVTADPAFGLRPAATDKVTGAWGQTPIPPPGVSKIGISIRSWGADRDVQIEEYGSLLANLSDKTGARLVLLPMQLPGDAEFSDAVSRKSGRDIPVIRGITSPTVMLGMIGSMDVIVAMRLHALIFAARMATPLFALAYDPKVDSLMDRLALSEYSTPWIGFDSNLIAGNA